MKDDETTTVKSEMGTDADGPSCSEMSPGGNPGEEEERSVTSPTSIGLILAVQSRVLHDRLDKELLSYRTSVVEFLRDRQLLSNQEAVAVVQVILKEKGVDKRSRKEKLPSHQDSASDADDITPVRLSQRSIEQSDVGGGETDDLLAAEYGENDDDVGSVNLDFDVPTLPPTQHACSSDNSSDSSVLDERDLCPDAFTNDFAMEIDPMTTMAMTAVALENCQREEREMEGALKVLSACVRLLHRIAAK